MPKISEERKAATRRRLVDAAISVVLNEGTAKMTTRRILEKAGLSAGALYHYFPSKDDLYESIAERFLELDLGIDESADLVDAHAAAVGDMFGPKTHTILGRLRVEALDNEAVREVMGRYDRKIVERYGALNQRTIDAGLFRKDLDGDALVELLSIFLEGFALRQSIGFATGRDRVLGVLLDALNAVAVDQTHADADELQGRLREVLAT